MSAAAVSQPVASPAPRRRVKVTPSMVASAQAQVEIAERLGKPVPLVLRKIAAVR